MAKTDDRAIARVLLLGLEDALAAELETVLTAQEQLVFSEAFDSAAECIGLIERHRADLIFCSSERTRYLSLLEALGRHKPDLPVVVVSRAPEVSEWLDAIEAGASDYCAAPFEVNQIQWILDSSLKRSSASLYRAAG